MGSKTNISWCDFTFNPWWGCWKISDECTHCYAEAFDHRLNGNHWGRTEPRKFFGDKHWSEPKRWNAAAEKAGERRRVFCASMSDVFERHPVSEINERMDEARLRLWQLVRDTPWLDWLLLTKRAENLSSMLPWMNAASLDRFAEPDPWANVWVGVTAGVRSSLERVAILRRTPAAVRFISCEPLLENIAASDWDWALDPPSAPYEINWLIVGDESGRGARPADPAWVATARDAAERHGVAFHFKQWAGADHERIGGPRVKGKRHLPLLDGVRHKAVPGGR